MKAGDREFQGTVTGAGFVDRGDTGSYDFDKNDLTTDDSYHDLDLSSIVPAGAKAVLLSVQMEDDAVGSYFGFRENGNTNEINADFFRTQGSGVWIDNCSVVVALDSNRIVEYRAANLTFSNINISVRAWWL